MPTTRMAGILDSAPNRPFNFRMAGLAGHRDRSPLLHIPLPLAMNLRHQWTCSIKDRQSKRGGRVHIGAGNGVGSPLLWRSRGEHCLADQFIADSLYRNNAEITPASIPTAAATAPLGPL